MIYLHNMISLYENPPHPSLPLDGGGRGGGSSCALEPASSTDIIIEPGNTPLLDG